MLLNSGYQLGYMGWNLHNYSEFEFWITLSQLLKLCNSEEWDVSLILIPYPYHLLTENIVRLFGFWYVFSLNMYLKFWIMFSRFGSKVFKSLFLISLNFCEYDSFVWIDWFENVCTKRKSVLGQKLHHFNKYAFRYWFLCFYYVFCVFLTVKVRRWIMAT